MPLHNEKGTALVLSLMFLLVMSLLVAVLHRDTLVEYASSRNYELSQHVFYAAESGLRAADGWLSDQGVAPEDGLTPPSWFYNVAVALPSADSGWSPYVSVDKLRYRYYLEHLKDASASVSGGESAKIGTSASTGGKVHFYRVTAEGSNPDRSIIKVVQLVTTARY
jgi:type IV pilus assembly protein PilX